ncbi:MULTISPECIES: hypothetical protein [Streptomyces]|uniref:hypothetical protein n=1 Tax=Streptomyces TaxID=1883 RepID=UPI0006EB7070|nr:MULTISPECIES: hypothetical protein [Streptomyces]MCF3120894.1 hypothetical protein [Streptomyces arenae]
MTAMDDRALDVRALINEVEGHLLVESARAEGRAAARQFTGRLPWLTETQRAEVEDLYTEEHLSRTRHGWQQVARRSTQLRAEYEETYRSLRRRLVAWGVMGAAVVLTLLMACGLS